jgi:hypothetical protein
MSAFKSSLFSQVLCGVDPEHGVTLRYGIELREWRVV